MAEELVVGALIMLAGMVTGRIWPARKRAPKPARPICGCRHDLAHHEPDGDGGGTACHQLVHGEVTSWDGYGIANGWEMVQCSCRQYTGPRVLDPGYTAREITGA
jgi:hypothetical protein